MIIFNHISSNEANIEPRIQTVECELVGLHLNEYTLSKFNVFSRPRLFTALVAFMTNLSHV